MSPYATLQVYHIYQNGLLTRDGLDIALSSASIYGV